MDEFGDSSFLDDFDVDQAIENANNPNAVATTSLATKRRRVHTDDRKVDTPDSALTDTLKHYFGYSKFREGQTEVIQGLLQGRDAAVFWATGSGKSLCFQIPALLQDAAPVLVVSPLISLMSDQVQKLNSKSSDGAPIATFLGTGQSDPTAEGKALRGQFRLIYVTPENLDSFLRQMSRSRATNGKPFSAIAVDEAHCVSEWGHDFRPDYRTIGETLRRGPHRELLNGVPIVALTATAVPRVQKDILQSLALHNPLVSKQSFDRNNLQITVKSRPSSIATTFQPLLENLRTASNYSSKQSTIIYAPTRAQVEDICGYLQTQLADTNVRVDAYHAGMTTAARHDAHVRFLTSQSTIIVATIAFGMGIDKPDTRRIIHYGPPKTLEEYYQQIGRAGRDGLQAECLLYQNKADFDKYHSEFYLKSLQGTALQSVLLSMKALQQYALDQETCRRRALLEYFEEVPAFGERCGTCDVCRNVAKHGESYIQGRDFGDTARLVLQAVSDLDAQGISTILDVMGEKNVDARRYKLGVVPSISRSRIQQKKQTLPKYAVSTVYRELTVALAVKGYLAERKKSMEVNGYKRTWAVYDLTAHGERALRSKEQPIVLPVPETLRESERKEAERRERVLAQLEANGIKRETLPPKELEAGDGGAVRAYSKWYGYLENVKNSGRKERLDQLESLLASIQEWRSDTAVKMQMAPASVVAEHILVAIAYATATLPPGHKTDSTALVAAGVRSKELEDLVQVLSQWVDNAQPMGETDQGANESEVNALMVLPEALPHTTPWKYAIYKPQKKTGMATWESSYVRFHKGESPQTIAMTPASGRPVQVQTVVGHILDAILHGRSVDVERLAGFMSPPDENEWKRLREAEAAMNMDVSGDPESSGVDGGKFTMTDFLRPIVGDEIASKQFSERTEEEKNLFAFWCNKLRWYMAFRRVSYEPTFSKGLGSVTC